MGQTERAGAVLPLRAHAQGQAVKEVLHMVTPARHARAGAR